MSYPGFVSLVGAGPGDPELLTLKALRRLREADVVVYDALVRPEVLDYAHPAAEMIAAGKRGGKPSAAQDWITDLLIEKARAGALVVRLKGGDPYVFGRGGEEAAALTQAGIAWEIVPGISAAIAAPAYAGIPVTHRAVASSVAFVTGHEDPSRPHTRIDWRALATGIDTVVFMMGIGRLPHIAEQLIAHGRPADTPTAVIHWGTTPEQVTLVAPLSEIAAEVERSGITPPAAFVVGEVVGLRDQLNWFEGLKVDLGVERTHPEPVPSGR